MQVYEQGKKTIKALSLHRQRNRWLRLDFLPFAILYLLPLGYFFSCDGTSDTARFPRLVALSCESLLLLLHVLFFLMQQWSKAFQCWVGYMLVDSIAAATHILAEPLPHCGTSAICTIVKKKSVESNGKLQYSFEFQRLMYRYSDQIPVAVSETTETETETAATATATATAVTNGFTRLEYPTSKALSSYRTSKGVSKAQYTTSKRYYGRNMIELPIPPFLDLFCEHLLAPFFVFQVFCVALWMLDEYWYYSLFTLVMLLIFESTVCYTRIKSMQNLRGQAKTPPNVYVYRNQMWSPKPVSSATLVPGDIVSLQTNRSSESTSTIPCDALLLRGSAIVNEAMLTGESVPMLKEPMLENSATECLRFTDGTDKQHQKHVLYCGTQILKLEVTSTSATAPMTAAKTSSFNIPLPPDRGAVAYVLRTGFGTTQGELMRTILFATERVTVGDTETLLLLLIMLIFAVFASAYVLNEGLKDPAASRWKLFLHCTMICTSVVPPELPMELSLAVTNSLNALRERMIYCVEPFRIPYAGKVDICCFDKTGTLTSDQFRVEGVSMIINNDDDNNNNTKRIEDKTLKQETKHRGSGSGSGSDDGAFHLVRDMSSLDERSACVLGCCHSILQLDGKMTGDPMEVATLNALGWTVMNDVVISAANSQKPTRIFDIVRRYGFSSSLKRMSVVVRERSAQNALYLFTKGAPEVMSSLYAKVPEGFSSEQRTFTSRGKRVLGLGWRSLAQMGVTSAAMLDGLERSTLECQLECSGLLILDSPLKPQSKPAIHQLIQSSHRVVVITGDNPLTACSVASQVGILSKPRTSQLILQNDLLWHPVAAQHEAQEEEKEVTVPFKDNADSILRLSITHDLCVTGGALVALADKYGTKQQARSHEVPARLMRPISTNVLVFARTAPVQKERILTSLKSQGYTTLMCGDGTNDVGALKQADVGISIINSIEMDKKAEIVTAIAKKKRMKRKKGNNTGTGNEELHSLLREMEMESQSHHVQLGDASVASGFTSKTASIACALDVIRQGRCTLVTTLQMYKILAVNCLVTAYNLSALYLHGIKQGDSQMTAVGLAVAAFFFFVSRSRPMSHLAKERPPSRVFSPFVLVSVVCQCTVHFAIQILALKWTQPYVDPSDPSMMRDGDFRPNVINTVVFIGQLVTQVRGGWG